MMRLAPLAIAAVLVTACGSAGTTTTPPDATASAASASSTGPAPLTVQVVSATKVIDGPAAAEVHGKTAWSKDVPAGQALVTVRWSMSNQSAAAISPVPSTRLVYGPNAIRADEATGWLGQAVLADSQTPEQIGAGQTVTVWRSWMIPQDQLAAAELRVTGGPAGEVAAKVPAPAK